MDRRQSAHETRQRQKSKRKLKRKKTQQPVRIMRASNGLNDAKEARASVGYNPTSEAAIRAQQKLKRALAKIRMARAFAI